MTIRLLIAEDDPGAGEALRAAFDDEEHEVELAATGTAARAAFAKGPRGTSCTTTS